MAIIKLLNETTTVPAEISAAEITKELVRAGAVEISTQYREGRVHGLSWVMPIKGSEVYFTMPARVEGVLRILVSRHKGYLGPERKQELVEKAQRVAWRHLYRWVQSQIAMIATHMLEPGEAFLSFATIPGGTQTLFERFSEFARLPAPGARQ